MSRFHTRITCAMFASVGALVMVATPSGTPGFGSGVSAAKDLYECMTDDGYGRKRSCSASYKAANPNWRGGDDCFTDDGYGRFRSCSASYKAKHQAKTQAK